MPHTQSDNHAVFFFLHPHSLLPEKEERITRFGGRGKKGARCGQLSPFSLDPHIPRSPCPKTPPWLTWLRTWWGRACSILTLPQKTPINHNPTTMKMYRALKCQALREALYMHYPTKPRKPKLRNHKR